MPGKVSMGDSNLVQFPPAEQSSCQCFRVGERVPVSGVYRAFHDGHRLSHEVTLLAVHVFPRCKTCGAAVHFELVREAPAALLDRGFLIELYEIPHPSDAESPTAEQIA